MPVRKYRDVSEMPDSPWLEPGSEALDRAMQHVFGLADEMFPRAFPPGVYKHRSIEDLNRQTEAWERADWLRLRAARQSAQSEAAPVASKPSSVA